MTTPSTPAAPQNFSSAYPFDVTLANQFSGSALPICYIVDKFDPAAAEQQVQVNIVPGNGQSYTLKGLGASTAAPDASNYQLAIALRPGTLNASLLATFGATLQAALVAVLNGKTCQVSAQAVSTGNDAAQVWYCRFTDDVVIPATGWSFTIKGIAAEPGAGSRSTTVEFQFANVLANGAGKPLSFSRLVHVNIINHHGSSHAPLVFGVLGDNNLLNQPGHANNLTLYFETLGRKPIQVAQGTQIVFSFAYDDNDSSLLHFGSQSEVAAYSLAQPADTSYAVSTTPPSNGMFQITATFNAAKSLVNQRFDFNTVQLSGSDGNVNVQVSVRNVPGFWDSNFQVAVSKNTSTDNAELALGRAATPGHLGLGSRIDFLSGDASAGHSDVSLEENSGLNIFGVLPPTPQDAGGGKPVRIHDADLLIKNGRVGIGNLSPNGMGGNWDTTDQPSPNPKEKLRVVGDSYFVGSATIENSKLPTGLKLDYNPDTKGRSLLIGNAQDLGEAGGPLCIAMPKDAKSSPFVLTKGGQVEWFIDKDANTICNGTFTSHGNISSNGNISAVNINCTGRMEDKTGPVMPVGSIIAYGGKTAPKGWLLCDGGVIPDQYADLIAVVGKNTPNLCGRTLLGAGAANNSAQTDKSIPNFPPNKNWGVGDTGGEFQHTLSVNEMPSHSHPLFYRNDGFVAAVGNFVAVFGTDRDGNPTGAHPDKPMQFTGGNQAHNNMQPYYAVNYIIKC